MSDKIRKVARSNDKLYYVYLKNSKVGQSWWSQISKGYPHSTSAYAALGRMVSKENS